MSSTLPFGGPHPPDDQVDRVTAFRADRASSSGRSNKGKQFVHDQ